MSYVALGYTERFPDYWELFSGRSGNPDLNTLRNEKPPSSISVHNIAPRSWKFGFRPMSVRLMITFYSITALQPARHATLRHVLLAVNWGSLSSERTLEERGQPGLQPGL